MRLINVDTLKLESFVDHRSAPRYAILSHTWGGPGDEVLFQELEHLSGATKEKKGWKKIEYTCIQAKKDELQYAWVDTCCIDKSSSAELSEAINSMYAWYEKSTVCYAYLADVTVEQESADAAAEDDDEPDLARDTSAASESGIAVHGVEDAVPESNKAMEITEGESIEGSKNHRLDTNPARQHGAGSSAADRIEPVRLEKAALHNNGSSSSRIEVNDRTSVDDRHASDSGSFEEQFKTSRWFTRGWTLQELLAPKYVEFFSSQWASLGSLKDLAVAVSDVTRIPLTMLHHEFPIASYSAAKRMSWASRRSTTRLEDEAYCLLGLFQINMPLLYGEGTNAFKRLQEEIFRVTQDLSLLAWDDTWKDDRDRSEALFATSPAEFIHSGYIRMIASRILKEDLGFH